MTPEEFVARCEAACAGFALLFANAPDAVFDRGLEHFVELVRDGLTERLADRATEERIAEIVDAMTRDSRLRRREIKSRSLH